MPASSSSPFRVNCVTMGRRQSPVSVSDLATMLELDLLTGDNPGFRRRLQRALNDAFRQGIEGPG